MFASLFAVPVFSSPAFALTDDELVEGAKLCTRYLPRQERKYGIPLHLLSAIASTESGRWHKGLNMALPWPWTVNSQGKGYYFDTKEEAVTFVQTLRAQGVSSMDVGCMQVNLHHHPDAFSTLTQAFEPQTNIEYAAKFLRNNYDEKRSWRIAASYYHSRTPSLGSQYVGSVFKSWQRIIAKVQNARAGIGTAVAAVSELPAQMAMLERSVPADAAPKSVPANRAAQYKPIRMRVIEVSRKDNDGAQVTRMNGVRIIRPTPSEPTVAAETATAAVVNEQAAIAKSDPLISDSAAPKPKEIQVAQATRSATDGGFVSQLTQSGKGAKVVHVSAAGNGAGGNATAVKNGPRFIFN